MKSTLIGLLLGIVLTAIIGWLIMPSLMYTETLSPYSVEETTQRIKQKALESDWVVPSITKLDKSVAKHSNDKLKLTPVSVVNLCQAEHAYGILKSDENKFISVMMPCTIGVYEKSDGKTYISTMNAGLLGSMFGGDIATVMAGAVATDQQAFVDFAIKN